MYIYMFENLKKLSEIGYLPEVIIDIGAYHGNWTKEMMKIYPTSKYFLFEPIDYDELDEIKNVENIKVYKKILNEKIDIVEWYEQKNTGDSFFKENTIHFLHTKPIEKETIDLNTFSVDENILKNENNIFIKIDCQGAEIPILKGATNILNKTDFIVMEIPLFGKFNSGVPSFAEHIKFMENIGFILYEIVENHYINGFNMQVDALFINKKKEVYDNLMDKPIIHSLLLSNMERKHVINYIKKNNFKVLDIGGSANSWSAEVCKHYVDLFTPNLEGVKYFNFNINFESEWELLFDYVKDNGKFDFCICSHTLEDISLPQVCFKNFNKISKEGFISFPSKYREFSKIEGEWLGYIHHRWVYSFKNNNLIGYPKVNFLEFIPEISKTGNKEPEMMDLSFFWKNEINCNIINNDYLGPCKDSVITYYRDLQDDDIDLLNCIIYHNNIKKYIRCFNIEEVKKKKDNNFILIKMLNIDISQNLQLLEEKHNLIPFDIYNVSEIEIKILFINKNHYCNKEVQSALLDEYYINSFNFLQMEDFSDNFNTINKKVDNKKIINKKVNNKKYFYIFLLVVLLIFFLKLKHRKKKIY